MCVCVCAAASHFLSFEKYVPSSSLYIHVCGIKVTWYNRRKSVFPNGGEFKESFLFRPKSYIIKVSRKLTTEVIKMVPINYIILLYTNYSYFCVEYIQGNVTRSDCNRCSKRMQN